MTVLFIGARLKVFNLDGTPLASGTVETFEAGTTTPKVTYNDAAGTVPKANPFTLDAYGEADCWLVGSYKFLIKDSLGVTLPGYPVDFIPGVSVSFSDLALSTGASIIGTASGGTVQSDLLLANGFKNQLDNGQFKLALNAGPVALTGGALINCIDKWAVYQNGTPDGTVAQVTDANGNTSMKGKRNAASAQVGAIVFVSRVKTVNAIPLQGKKVTLSFWATAGANFSAGSSTISVGLYTGTGTDEPLVSMAGWTGGAAVIGSGATVTTTKTRFSFVGTLSSTQKEIGIQIFFTPTGVAGADDSLTLEDIQLEVGGIATEMERPPSIYEEYIQRPVTPACGRLSNLITMTGPVPGADPFDSCHFIPYDGNQIFINGRYETIPDGALAASGGIQARYASCYLNKVAAQSLSNNTFYFIYAWMNNGVIALNFSTTGYVQNGALYGNAVKSDDPTCTLVGICYIKVIGGIPITYGGARGQTICSYFNRFRANLLTGVSGSTTNNAATLLTQLPLLANGEPTNNYLEFVAFYDSFPLLYAIANADNSAAGNRVYLGIGLNSSVAITGMTAQGQPPSTLSGSVNLYAPHPPSDATGYYYATALGYETEDTGVAGNAGFSGYFIAQGVMV